MPAKNPLLFARPPWVRLLLLKNGQTHDALVSVPEDFAVKVVQGKKCKTQSGLWGEFARTLKFPEYFGHNWDALEECLADLEWLPAKGYVVVVTDAEQVLPTDDENYETFIEILNDAGEAWSHSNDGARPVPFHVVLAVSERHKTKRKNWGGPLLKV